MVNWVLCYNVECEVINHEESNGVVASKRAHPGDFTPLGKFSEIGSGSSFYYSERFQGNNELYSNS